MQILRKLMAKMSFLIPFIAVIWSVTPIFCFLIFISHVRKSLDFVFKKILKHSVNLKNCIHKSKNVRFPKNNV